jgi:hypothetical protein
MNITTQTLLAAREEFLSATSTPSDDVTTLWRSLQGPQIGRSYLLRSPTVYTAGVLVEMNAEFFALTEAVSIPSTGPTAKFSTKDPFEMQEVYDPSLVVFFPRNSIIEIVEVPYGKGK